MHLRKLPHSRKLPQRKLSARLPFIPCFYNEFAGSQEVWRLTERRSPDTVEGNAPRAQGPWSV